jgi:hypothetical protein
MRGWQNEGKFVIEERGSSTCYISANATIAKNFSMRRIRLTQPSNNVVIGFIIMEGPIALVLSFMVNRGGFDSNGPSQLQDMHACSRNVVIYSNLRTLRPVPPVISAVGLHEICWQGQTDRCCVF